MATRKTIRHYYGFNDETGEALYINMKVRNATQKVKMNGKVEHAMAGELGLSIGCHLSVTSMANKKAFPHPALGISFTKTLAIVFEKIVRGVMHSVRYKHNYSKYVDLNDNDPSKKMVKSHPELFNRQFTLLPYRPSKNHWKPEYGRRVTGKRSTQAIMRGEMARLKKAGYVNIMGKGRK